MPAKSADLSRPDPVLKGPDGPRKFRASAESLEKLTNAIHPTFSWDRYFFMWIRESGTNGPVFELDRAFVLETAGGKLTWVMLETGEESNDWPLKGVDPAVAEQLTGPELIRGFARLVKRKPEPTHDGGGAGYYALVVGTDKAYGTVYEIGWESLMGQGTGHPVDEKRLYVLKDKTGHWQFIGEGPSEDWGKSGWTCGGTGVTAKASAAPEARFGVKVSFLLTNSDVECHEFAPGDVPLRDRIEHQAAVLDGTSPKFHLTGRPYMLAETAETFEGLVHHLSTWSWGWESDREGARQKIASLWRKELVRLNPGLATGKIAKGVKVNILTEEEIRDRFR